MVQLRKCSSCSEEKEFENFYKSKMGKYGISNICKSCSYIRTTNWQKKNKEKCAESARTYRLKNPDKFKTTNQKTKLRLLYGMTIANYKELLNSQDGVCFICKNKETVLRNGKTYDLSVDHCHETQLNRGLLCRNCNTALGMLKDNPELLRKAADYIEFHKARHERTIMEEKQNSEVAVPLTELISTP